MPRLTPMTDAVAASEFPDSAYHGAIAQPPKTGAEQIRDEQGIPRGSLLGFWRWAYSQTLDNALRGVLAEYLVGLALGGPDRDARVEWDPYDLTTADGVKVEVKSTAYLQSWAQNRKSVLKFNIPETNPWDAVTGTWGSSRVRQSDVYVFCVFTAVDPDTADPLDMSQWDFYVAPTSRVNEVLGGQKTVVLSSLIQRVAPKKVTFTGLADAVRTAGS
ncbi:hypothetical protein Csp1_18600 [Corynebacterium provencense]|uniref:Uncharacterized protein n=2 Tax=Corynebacterium provencense TaxID=1737425 RepID=A0A2Z3YZ79_9CORY|nr:hypothetical protein Csp1_18600 [Corynebacterium provencense]